MEKYITTLSRPEKPESEEDPMHEKQWIIKPTKMVPNWSPFNKQFYGMDDES